MLKTEDKMWVYDLDSANAEWNRCDNSGPNCLEWARLAGDAVAVRDSKTPGGSELRFTPEEWEAFTLGVRDGEFDVD